MAALSVIGTNLLTSAMVPLTKTTGGNSVSDPSAGTESPNTQQPGVATKPITTTDRAGAGILTLLIIVGVISGAWWINVE
jgi:mannan endo-1,6-alpha-mannosidase